MKEDIKHKFRGIVDRILSDLPRRAEVERLNQRLGQSILNSQVLQRSLFFQYQGHQAHGQALPRFQDAGFRVYSQTDEDGLLLYLFALIGMTNKVCVEIAFGRPNGANTTNLICNWGWNGLLIEGNASLADESKQFFATHSDTFIFPPKIVESWVTAENINNLLQENGILGEIDLFCLDMDGVDYWIWKSLEVIRPRVVVVEYQDVWGPEKSMTIPYRADFVAHDTTYMGASLLAFTKLARDKGYRLIGCNRYGFNAFFVRSDIGETILPTVEVGDCLQHPKVTHSREERLAYAKSQDWVEV